MERSSSHMIAHYATQNNCERIRIREVPYYIIKIFENVLKKILGKTAMIKSSYKWMPERIDEEEIDEIIERLIRKD